MWAPTSRSPLVSLNGWPAMPVLDGPNTDAGTFALSIPVLWTDYPLAGEVTVRLSCHSLTAQDGLTLVVRVGAAVCTAPGEALARVLWPPPAGTAPTCTFGDQSPGCAHE